MHGKVQGVFFRQSTREQARRDGITGSVSNEKDGTVRIIATGDEEHLAAFTEWCRRGPSKARVDRVELTEIPLQPDTTFTIERSQ